MEYGEFVELAALVNACAKPKDGRPILASVNIRREGSDVIAEATDSYILAERTFDYQTFGMPIGSDDIEVSSILLSGQGLTDAFRTFTKARSAFKAIADDEFRVRFGSWLSSQSITLELTESSGTNVFASVTVRTEVGSFPRTDTLWPESNGTDFDSVGLDPYKLVRAFKTAGPDVTVTRASANGKPVRVRAYGELKPIKIDGMGSLSNWRALVMPIRL